MTDIGSYTVFRCDLCGEDRPVEVPYARLYTGDQPVHICGNCGFVYVRERRSAKEIARVWSDQIYGSVYSAQNNPAVIARQIFVAEFLAGNSDIAGKRICDIGAGEGLFLKYLAERYSTIGFGIEPSLHNCKLLADAGIGCFNGTIEQFNESLQGSSYQADVVTIMWTLENCTSCIDMLKGARALLTDGGKIVVATGSRILVPFKKPLFMYFSGTPMDSHSFRFSANSLQNALGKTGFKTLATNRFVDSDILCILAEKMPNGDMGIFCKDNPAEVHSFFERWHWESIYYVREHF